MATRPLRRGAERRARLGPLALALAVLAGCGGLEPAPVAERSSWEARRDGVHVVHRGETLYSIAWRYGVDWRALARRNGVSPPFTIHPGDRLRIAGKRERGSASGGDAGGEGGGERDAAPARGSPRWSWPLDGEIVRGFAVDGETLNKGLDIRGASGEAVVAAADGEVVYAGGGLRGFGRLVIVKHDARWLSAYAHNNPILVREGQRVGAGDKLAEIDGNGERARLLHFEIRRGGDPIDPAAVLPAR